MVCAGNPLEYCGAGNRLELYSTNNTTVPVVPAQPATVVAGGVGWKFKNCYTEGTAGRALGGGSYAADDVTLESCAAYCASFAFFGTEYGRECYCGNSLGTGSVVAGAGECSMPCAGDGSELCGAGSRLSVYSKQ